MSYYIAKYKSVFKMLLWKFLYFNIVEFSTNCVYYMPSDNCNLIMAKLDYFTIRHHFSLTSEFRHNPVCTMYASWAHFCPSLCIVKKLHSTYICETLCIMWYNVCTSDVFGCVSVQLTERCVCGGVWVYYM